MLYVCYTIPSVTTAFEIRDIASVKNVSSNCYTFHADEQFQGLENAHFCFSEF